MMIDSFFFREVEALHTDPERSAMYVGVIHYFLTLTTELLAQIIVDCQPQVSL